jgi:hypothetical protein
MKINYILLIVKVHSQYCVITLGSLEYKEQNIIIITESYDIQHNINVFNCSV